MLLPRELHWLLSAFAFLTLFCNDPASASAGSAVVKAAAGSFRGERLAENGGVFRGIRYAKAPVGKLRWRAPQSLPPAKALVDATSFGPACPQGQGNPKWYRKVAALLGNPDADIPDIANLSEDCLFLNIWSPDVAPKKSAPVMVWIHGGSNVNGYGHEPNYLGHHLAPKGVVVVSINYRLGLLGFFAHPALGNAASGQQAIQDQIAALRWINANISAFGGNPQNVTLFGESAGGTNIYALMQSSEAVGLFHRAILQSAYLGDDAFVAPSQKQEAAIKAFGPTASADQLGAMPWQDIVARQAEALPGHFYQPVAGAGKTAPVPLMIGFNRDEWRMYLPAETAIAHSNALEAFPPEHRDAVDKLLARLSDDPKTRADLLTSAPGFSCPTRKLANAMRQQNKRAFVYLFNRVRPGEHDLGAYHGAEIPYIFDTADSWLPSDQNDIKLTAAMLRYWVNFATNGDPNGSGLVPWPVWDGGNIMELGNQLGSHSGDPFELCTFIDRQK